MQVLPVNPVLQALSGAQETGAVRQHSAAGRAETAQAVSAPAKSEPGNHAQVRTHREPTDHDKPRNTPRGGLVDIIA